MTAPLPVIWQKNPQNNEWFDVLKLDLNAPYFLGKKGVFVVWNALPGQAKVIVIGSGNLADQFKNLRANPGVIQFSNNGPLKISWVAANGIMNESQILGVEAFLYAVYKPILGSSPNVQPIEVKLIGQA